MLMRGAGHRERDCLGPALALVSTFGCSNLCRNVTLHFDRGALQLFRKPRQIRLLQCLAGILFDSSRCFFGVAWPRPNPATKNRSRRSASRTLMIFDVSTECIVASEIALPAISRFFRARVADSQSPL